MKAETLVSLWTRVRDRLKAAGVDSPVLDARLLIETGARVSRLEIITDPRRELRDEQVIATEALVRRREAREPVAHIIGRRHFWKLELSVTPDVLVPRPETEFVVEAALSVLPSKTPARVLDLGVGSGAILLSILAERPEVTGLGIDASEAALSVARRNAEELGLQDRVAFRLGDWANGIDERFDVVVSNPPYIASGDIASLQPEVARFEPRLALDGGADGLDAHRVIVRSLPHLLSEKGAFALEVGRGQAAAVTEMARAEGLSTSSPWLDLAGIPRVVRGGRAA
jgi:release factor glutamine methyltransferase